MILGIAIGHPRSHSHVRLAIKEQAAEQCQALGIPDDGQLEDLRVEIRLFLYPLESSKVNKPQVEKDSQQNGSGT